MSINSSPRIALYMTGHVRTWTTLSHDALSWIIAGYQVDIFAALHDTLDRADNTDWEVYKAEQYTASPESIKALFAGLPIREFTIDSHTLEPPIEMDMFRTAAWKMWRKVHECNEMRKVYERANDITYDYIVRYRPDTIIMERIPFEFLPKLDTSIICGFGPTLGWPDDLFAIGNPMVMDHYCNIEKAFIPGCGPHKIAGLTFDVYPQHSYIQTAFVRRTIDHDDYHPNREIFKFGKWFLTYFNKDHFGHHGCFVSPEKFSLVNSEIIA